MFLKNKNIIFKIRRSKVTDYAALKINLLSLLFLLFLKIRNPLSFVISIINLFVVLFLTITN